MHTLGSILKRSSLAAAAIARHMRPHPSKVALVLAKHTKQPSKNVYLLVIFCGIRHDNLKNPPSEPQWLLSVLQLLKTVPLILISFIF